MSFTRITRKSSLLLLLLLSLTSWPDHQQRRDRRRNRSRRRRQFPFKKHSWAMRRTIRSRRCLRGRRRRAARRNWLKNDASRRFCRNCPRLRMRTRRSSSRCTRHIKMHDCVMIYLTQHKYPQVALSSRLKPPLDKRTVFYPMAHLLHPTQNETAWPKSGIFV